MMSARACSCVQCGEEENHQWNQSSGFCVLLVWWEKYWFPFVFVHDQLLFLSSCQILYKFQYFQAQSLILISKLKKHHVYIIYTPSPPNYVYNTHVHIFQFCWYHHQNPMLGNILMPARVKSSPPINLCKLKLKFERREANIFFNPENIQKGHTEFCLKQQQWTTITSTDKMWKSNKTYRFTVVSFERRDIPVLIRILCISWDQRQLGIVTIPHTIIGVDIVVLHPKSIAFGCSSSLLGSCRKWSWLPVFVPVYRQAKRLELELWILWMQNVQQRHRWQIWTQPVGSNAKLYSECILTRWPSPLAKYCRTVKKL